MFKQRLISGIILLLAAFLSIYTGGAVLIAVLAAISVIGVFELYRAVGITPMEENRYRIGLLGATGLIASALWYLVIGIAPVEFYAVYLMLAVMAFLCVYVFRWPAYEADQVMKAAFAVIYPAVMLSSIALVRQMETGKITVWLIFISAWGADTCAYCAGMLLGRHKMAPNLSPKKSVEGAVGGVVGAVLLGVIYAAVFKQPMLEYGLICFFGALISMVGDLAASAIKRNKGIKDYGKLIPGHGGILDRFDSIVFTGPVIYALALFLLGK